MSSRKLNPIIYRKAANRVMKAKDTLTGACDALRRVTTLSNRYSGILCDFYEKSNFSYYFEYDGNEEREFLPEFECGTKLGNLRRAIALDLIATLLETNELDLIFEQDEVK